MQITVADGGNVQQVASIGDEALMQTRTKKSEIQISKLKDQMDESSRFLFLTVAIHVFFIWV